jgi:hypothetical protein
VSETPDPDELLAIQAHIISEVAARQAAVRELAELGIMSVSPNDIESWMSFTPKQRRHAALAWGTFQAAYL